MAKKLTAEQVIQNTNLKKAGIREEMIALVTPHGQPDFKGIPVHTTSVQGRIIARLVQEGIFPIMKKADWKPDFEKYPQMSFNPLWFAEQMALYGIENDKHIAYYGSAKALAKVQRVMYQHCKANAGATITSEFVPDEEAGFTCESHAKTAHRGGYMFRTKTSRKVHLKMGLSMLAAMGEYMLPREVFMYNENMIIYSLRGVYSSIGIDGRVKVLDCSWIQPHGTSMKSVSGYIGVYMHPVDTREIAKYGNMDNNTLNIPVVYHSEKSPADAYNGVLRKAKKEAARFTAIPFVPMDNEAKPAFTKTVSLRALRKLTGWCQAGCNAWISENMPDYIGKTSAPVPVVLSILESKTEKTAYETRLTELLKGKPQISEVPAA